MNKKNTIERSHIVSLAREWLGTPYVHQASAKGVGTDCLGLVRGVWHMLYGEAAELPPPYTPDWAERNGDELLRAAAKKWLNMLETPDLRAGDVVLFRVVPDGPAKHMGILSGTDKFIHAYAGRAVCESWLNRWWLGRMTGQFCFPGVVQ